jgi:hypothetical protein
MTTLLRRISDFLGCIRVADNYPAAKEIERRWADSDPLGILKQ